MQVLCSWVFLATRVLSQLFAENLCQCSYGTTPETLTNSLGRRPCTTRLYNQPINQPINQSIDQSINQSINQSIKFCLCVTCVLHHQPSKAYETQRLYINISIHSPCHTKQLCQWSLESNVSVFGFHIAQRQSPFGYKHSRESVIHQTLIGSFFTSILPFFVFQHFPLAPKQTESEGVP